MSRSRNGETLSLRRKTPAAIRELEGLRIFEVEASFCLDGTLHQTWSRVGVQPRVDA